MNNNITSQLYTEYFNIIKLEFELLNELLKRQTELHSEISRIVSNHQNILSNTPNAFNNSNSFNSTFYPSFFRNRNNPFYPERSTLFRSQDLRREGGRRRERRDTTRIPRVRHRNNRQRTSNLQTFINNTLNTNTNSPNPATIDQIVNNTSIHVWNDISNNDQTICPIARTPFTNNDIICKINHCGHIFTHSELLKWFTKDTRCPVCRFNIANDISNNTNDVSNNTNDVSNNTNDVSNNIYNNVPTTTTNTFSDNFNLSFNNRNNISNDLSNNFLNLTNNISNLLFNELSDMSNNIITAEFSFNIPNIEPFSDEELDV